MKFQALKRNNSILNTRINGIQFSLYQDESLVIKQLGIRGERFRNSSKENSLSLLLVQVFKNIVYSAICLHVIFFDE